jgi:hypothetical protein
MTSLQHMTSLLMAQLKPIASWHNRAFTKSIAFGKAT